MRKPLGGYRAMERVVLHRICSVYTICSDYRICSVYTLCSVYRVYSVYRTCFSLFLNLSRVSAVYEEAARRIQPHGANLQDFV